MKTYLSSLLLEEQTYFSVSKFTCSPKKESEKWRIHISGKSMYSLYCSQFHTDFLQWMSIHYGSTYQNYTELLCDTLGQHHCKNHSQLYSLYNTKLRHQIQFLRVRCHQGLSMKRGSVFRIPHIQWVYPMPYSILLHKPHWNLGPGFISISPARMIRINKFVPFEGLKLRSPSELLRFPSFLILAKHWETLLWECL